MGDRRVIAPPIKVCHKMWAQMKNIKEKSAAICHIASIFDAEIFYLRQVLWQDLIGGAIVLYNFNIYLVKIQ